MKRHTLKLFLLGLFSATQIQIGGSIGISELVVFLVAPIVFARNFRTLRHDGFMPLIVLSLMTVVGCVISSIANYSHVALMFKGAATCYSLFAFTVVFHGLLKDDIMGIRPLLLGICFSGVINVFYFHRAVETFGVWNSHKTQIEAVMSGTLFWMSRIGPFMLLVVRGWYLQTPTWVSVALVLTMPIFTMATTESGRSATIIALAASAIIIIGSKRIVSMRRIQKHIVLFAVLGVIGCFFMKSGYSYLAENGYLNEKATAKYRGQVVDSGNKGILSILIGGRAETFVGLYAAMKRPVLGYGPWARDTGGVVQDFLYKYGDSEDIENHRKTLEANLLYGIPGVPVPAHSFLVGFWVYYGLLALPFWLYVFYLMYKHVRLNMAAVPQLYGYFAVGVCSHTWNILFSPYTSRVESPLFLVLILLVDAIRRGRRGLTIEMQKEIMSRCR